MKLSCRWLGELVDLAGVPGEEVARLLTFHTAHVEGIEPRGQGLEGIVTARVVAVRPHPNADRLRLCTVDRGAGGTTEVVCGAPNVAEGQIVCYAPEGTTLPGGLVLERRRIRGVESAGMILAEDELGLGEDHEGILVLPPDTQVGVEVGEALGVRDVVLDVENKALTHRPDLWGHAGFARELGAILRRRPVPPSVAGAREAIAGASGAPFPVSVASDTGCRRYVALVIEGIRNGPSPEPLRRRLEALGTRSIDLLVDLTNLVLLEQGQPLHAFDLRRVRGGRIDVRLARAGERITTLDGLERALDPEDVVIADGERAVAIAGVMGGADSEVRADTTAVLLESATFDPARIRRTAARLGLRTEASTRFEKSLDPVQAETGALRFLELLRQLQPDVRVARPMSDVYPGPYAPVHVTLAPDLVRRRLGVRCADAEMKEVLTALGFGVREEGGGLAVDVPSWRATKDVTRAEDLVEEVGRIRGYDLIAPRPPLGALVPTMPPADRRLERRVAAVLSLELGYHETRTYSFYGPRDVERLGLGDTPHVHLAAPYTEEQDRLALTAAPALLRVVGRNLPREPRGRVWAGTRLIRPADREDGLADETRAVATVTWDREAAAEDEGRLFLDAVEDLRAFFEAVPVPGLEVREAAGETLGPGLPEPAWLHPGRRAALCAGDAVLALVGEVRPSVLRAYDLEGRVTLAEVDLDATLRAMGEAGATYRPILRYPLVHFDVAVIVPRRTPAADVVAAVDAAAPRHVRDVRVFDVYEGEGIPAGHRSLALRCALFDQEGTLDPAKADALRTAVQDALGARGWTVRAGA